MCVSIIELSFVNLGISGRVSKDGYIVKKLKEKLD
jgi:hypothetical protein